MDRRHADVERKMKDLITRAERSARSSQGGVPMAHLLRRMDHYRELRGRCESRPGDQTLLAWLDSIILALGEFGAPKLLDPIVTCLQCSHSDTTALLYTEPLRLPVKSACAFGIL